MTRGPQAVWWGFAAGLALSAAAGGVAAQPLRTPMAETGVFGGRFVIGALSDAKTFNPILSNETSSSEVSDRLFTSLTETDNLTRQNRPALAKRWDASRDGRVWTWHLRRGARFSDGHPITAADVLFSFAVAYDSTLHPSIYDLLSPHGRRIQVSAPDSYTVVMRLVQPHALLVQAVGALRILPKHVLEPVWRAGRFASSYGVGTHPDSLVTSGPWRLKQYVPHEKTVLTRNPHWFGVDARGRRLPYLDELVFVVVPDQNTCALRFEGGEVDALDNVKAEDYRRFERGQARGGYVVHRLGASLTSNFLWFNLNTVKRAGGRRPVGTPYADPVRHAWFANRDFRRAVSMAVDRAAIIRSIYFGEGAKSWSILTPGYGAFHDPAVTAPDHDPAGARRLLARLGFRDRDGDGVLEDARGNPVRFTLKTNAGSVRVQMANFVRDDLARVGIDCRVAAVDYNTLIVNMREDFDYDAILAGLGGAVPPDPAMCGNFYRSSGATHFWNVRQPRPETVAEARVDSLFDRLLLPGTLAGRRALSSRIDRILNEECWLVWLPVMKVELPVRDRFGNIAPNLLPHRVLWNIETVFVKPRSRGAGR